ncbi:hypothetical protein [Empedobacter brevis]|uniref:hypothetical protein n=1 Tax=Empedobacter brevis TaxID=247 RepID=UPI0011BF9A6C|nr:hypothetical protein [Empedobacter brevis]
MSKIYMGVIVPCMVILPITICLFRTKNWDNQVRILFFYLILSGVFNLIAKLTARTNNLPFLHLYTVLEFITICLFFKGFIRKKSGNFTLNSLIVSFFLLALWYAFIEESLFVFNKIPRFSGSLTITIMCLHFLIKDLGSIKANLSNFQFLAIMGLLFYYSTCAILFGLSDELLKIPRYVATMFWNIHASLNMLMYILFALGFYCIKNKRRG